MQRLLTRALPEPPANPSSPQAVVQQALDMPQFLPVRIFWHNFNELRPWWPVLVPMLLWIGWRSYHRERARMLRRAARKRKG